METGDFNVVERTFDIANVNETETSILLTNTQVSLTYRNEAGQLVKLTKTVPPSTGLVEYKKPVTDQRLGAKGDRLKVYCDGYLCVDKTATKGPKLLMNLDWDALPFATRTFTKGGDVYGNGAVTYQAASVPVTLS